MENVEVFEFVGLPGSGKSSITNMMEEQVAFISRKTLSKYTQDRSDFDKIFSFILFLIKRFKVVLYCFAFITQNWDGDFRCIKRSYLLLKFASNAEVFLKEQRDCIVIFDQGVIQDIWAIMLHTKGKRLKFANKMILLIIEVFNLRCIYVDIDELTSITRIKTRMNETSRFDSMERELALRVFIEKKSNFDILLSFIGFDRVLKINTNDKIEENSIEVISWIEKNSSITLLKKINNR